MSRLMTILSLMMFCTNPWILTSAAAENPPLPASIERAGAAVVAVRTRLVETRPAPINLEADAMVVSYERRATGVIIDPAGLIITNYHTVAHAPKIFVVLQDGKEHPARVVRSDQIHDLSLLKIIPPAPLPYLTLANSNVLKLNDAVFAIADSQWPHQKIAAGIISYLETGFRNGHTTIDAIQCAIELSKGDSGGAILNQEGKLVGLITARENNKPGYTVAIPANMIARLLKD